jgi:thiamine pyrophosphate-dependent acetolactate synthase large subunit-like protein
VPDTHPLGAGVLGRSGTPVANWLMNESDLLIVVGASFSNHTGIAAYKPIVQIDDDHAAIGRFDAVTVDVLGDAVLSLTTLIDKLGPVKADDQRPDVAERWAIWPRPPDGAKLRRPPRGLRRLRHLRGPDAPHH